MVTIIQFLIGALACLVVVFVARQAGRKWEAIIYAVALVIAALIYVGFATAGGAAGSWIALELVGLVLFLLAALLGLKISIWFLALGWAAHGVWDVLLHNIPEVPFVPEWYPIVCFGLDVFLAGYITMYLGGGRRLGAT